MSDNEILKQCVEPLLAFYDRGRRILPWREEPTPYHVWVSEIMLQQTRVEAVKPYYDRFMKALPDIRSLSQAEEEKLLKLWEGLGYYNRVRNMKKAAEILVVRYGGEMVPSESLQDQSPSVANMMMKIAKCFMRVPYYMI